MHKKSGATHSVMPKKLADALMEAGVQHFVSGGEVYPGAGTFQSSGAPNATPTTQGSNMNTGQFAQDWATVNVPGMINDFGQMGRGLAGSFTAQNQYVAGAPNIDRQWLQPFIQDQYKKQSDVYSSQNILARQLLNQAMGTAGPSVAQQQLSNATGQNVATQGAMMAGQRGASANPALMARQAARQGAQIQQQSAGQGAALRAQEQLAAQQAAAQQQAAMANEALQSQSILQGAQAAQNTALTTGQLGSANINARTASENAAATNSTFGGILGGVAAAFGMAKGGTVPKLADGGLMGIQQYSTPSAQEVESAHNLGKGSSEGVKKGVGAGLGSMMPSFGMACGGPVNMVTGGNVLGKALMAGDSPKNDTVPAMLSPGEIVLPRSVTQSPNMEAKAIEFLQHLKAKRAGYGDVIEARVQKKNCGGRV